MQKTQINGKTQLACIIGDPVYHSLSPIMHNSAYQSLGLNWVYVAFRVKKENLQSAVMGIKSLGIRGVSVTIPHKVAVLSLLDSLDAVAEKIGAINTIVNQNGKLYGYNTDWEGAMLALKEKTRIQGKKVVLIGAGGAGRAIAFGLKKEGAEVTILNRTVEKAKNLAKEIDAKFGGLEDLEVIKESDIVVNATSVGMHPKHHECIVPKELLHSNLTVFDIVYTPKETELLKRAKEKGAKIVYGYKMLLYQAVRQFELFVGRSAPTAVMEEALLRALQDTKSS